MSRSAFGSAARINLRELLRRAIKLPMKKLGHAIEDWVANQSPMGNSSIIDAKAFEWVERLEKNSEVIRRETRCFALRRARGSRSFGYKSICPIFKKYPRGRRTSAGTTVGNSISFVLGHRIDESYYRCPETGKLLDSATLVCRLRFLLVLAPGMHIKAHGGKFQGCSQVSSWIDRTGAAEGCPYEGR